MLMKRRITFRFWERERKEVEKAQKNSNKKQNVARKRKGKRSDSFWRIGLVAVAATGLVSGAADVW